MAEFRYRIEPVEIEQNENIVNVTTFTINGYSEFIKALDNTYKLGLSTTQKDKYIISTKNILDRIKYVFYHPRLNKDDEDTAIQVDTDTITIYNYNFTSLEETILLDPSGVRIKDLDTFMKTLAI